MDFTQVAPVCIYHLRRVLSELRVKQKGKGLREKSTKPILLLYITYTYFTYFITNNQKEEKKKRGKCSNVSDFRALLQDAFTNQSHLPHTDMLIYSSQWDKPVFSACCSPGVLHFPTKKRLICLNEFHAVQPRNTATLCQILLLSVCCWVRCSQAFEISLQWDLWSFCFLFFPPVWLDLCDLGHTKGKRN